MTTIGIIGANGQVGAETSLYLSLQKDINIIPICRTAFAAAFLKRAGLECRIGNISDPREATLLLKDCDLVADFTYIKGLPSEIKATSKGIIFNAMKYSSEHAKFVFASSMMAFGMGKNDKEFKSYLIARSVYGAMKRFSEKMAFKTGKQFAKEVYILRIGQVHGELQEVSRIFLKELKSERCLIPACPSYTVFPYTIAEALVNIAKGKEMSGIYTLVSKPEWNWQEVYEYYCQKAKISPQIILSNINVASSKSIKQKILRLFFKILKYYAEVIASYILVYFPNLEKQAMAKYYIKKAREETAERMNEIKYAPFTDIHHGKILGKRLKSLSDSRVNMIKPSIEVSKLIKSIHDLCNV
ncbi:MAG: hypothetical protein A3B68_07940 [Candidatus Melainabacteria bacterium RIFCSPHIGHO2_02_FULL_34_12]|nr:MAG: hypothetical protein A3B68_07940 [Candidatus Melainabacteria bacterium RIFCSPHIGHO2_02_FULL_34_12]